MEIDESHNPVEELFDVVLKVLLYLGGIFQLVCIIATFAISDKPATKSEIHNHPTNKPDISADCSKPTTIKKEGKKSVRKRR